MERSGLVTRDGGPGNRRAQVVGLPVAGERAGLGDADVGDLRGLLEQLVENAPPD